ncbi:hypothetical protein [Kribbella italica]|uniref:Uncharacterized protein n=1 Tax=Kribbella italica TaxID=1540520 RepID=A0A7W9J1G7_9ACTN|nr:hypothetical protein [Kribbella italica]MBB5833395.1 hypothetical protein [Kribbella italica]
MIKNLLKKTPPTPSLGEQYGAALALHSSAASVFENLIEDHVQAEAELSAVANEATFQIEQAEIAYADERERMVSRHERELDDLEADHSLKVTGLSELADAAYNDAWAAYDRAEKIRALV